MPSPTYCVHLVTMSTKFFVEMIAGIHFSCSSLPPISICPGWLLPNSKRMLFRTGRLIRLPQSIA